MDVKDLKDLRRLNLLWGPIYPYLAEWIGRWSSSGARRLMEVGPFSGGISKALLRLYPDARALFITSEPFVAKAIREDFGQSLEAVAGDLDRLPFRSSFDLVVFRGAFFFLTADMIRDIYRVLGKGGAALVGGGYGTLTPQEEIERIAEESKDLNARLGKRWLSREDLVRMVEETGLEDQSRILEEGGLWLLLGKDLP